MRRAVMGLALAVLMLAAPPAQAQGGHQADPLGFADSLCEAGDLYRAIGEYKRVIYLEPEGSPLLGRARLHLAACTARAAEWAQAAELLSVLAGEPGPAAEPALFELGLVQYLAGEPGRAAESFEAFAERYPRSGRLVEARLMSGLSRLAAVDYAGAATVFEEMSEVPCAARLAAAARHPALPERSPALAGLFSAVLPGAGQLYCGRPGQALASLALTGLTVFGAWAAWSNDYQGAGTIAALVAASAYAGGIRSAVSCASQHNRQVRERWLSGLAEGCGLVLVPGRVAFTY